MLSRPVPVPLALCCVRARASASAGGRSTRPRFGQPLEAQLRNRLGPGLPRLAWQPIFGVRSFVALAFWAAVITLREGEGQH